MIFFYLTGGYFRYRSVRASKNCNPIRFGVIDASIVADKDAFDVNEPDLEASDLSAMEPFSTDFSGKLWIYNMHHDFDLPFVMPGYLCRHP